MAFPLTYHRITNSDFRLCSTLVTDDPEVYLQRQVHRQIYAERNNFVGDQFNWRKTSSDERTEKNVREIFRFLSTAPLPQNIRNRTKSFVEASFDRFQ